MRRLVGAFLLVATAGAHATSITTTSPAANETSAPRSTSIAATAGADIDATSVTQSTFAIQGNQTGRISGSHSTTGTTFELDPASDLKPGELIRVTATNGIEDDSDTPIAPRVWQFTAAASAASGVFARHATFGAADTRDAVLGDLDGDGDLDALMANAGAETVWLNDGNANFSPHPTAPSFGADTTFAIALGDLDGDGDLDAVAGTWQPPFAETVWLNDGTGAFTAHGSFGAGDTWDLVLGDIDADGDLDCLVANHSFEKTTIWRNDGAANFTAHPTVPAIGSNNDFAVTLGDVDGDGDLDAVIGLDGPETVWLNDGSGAFTAHPTTSSFGSAVTLDVALGDLDADGDLDLVAVGEGDESVWVNDGAGNFTAHPTTPAFNAGFNSQSVALGDVDGDGDLDGVIAHFSGINTVWLNDGDGDLSPHPVAASFVFEDAVNAAPLGDLDGDGDLDALTASCCARTAVVWINSEISISETSGLSTTEAGGTDAFTIVLNRQPAADVTIGVASNDTSEATVSPAQLTFTSTNWSTPQSVTVQGEDDDVDDGHIEYTIVTAAAVSGDPVFSGVDVSDVTGTNSDDDTVGFNAAPLSIAVEESGTTQTFDVQLQSEPVGNVVINVHSNDLTEVTVSASQLTFTSANWDEPQIVTATGIDDTAGDGHQITAITLAINTAATADPLYDGVEFVNVICTTLDDDFRISSRVPDRNARSAPRDSDVIAFTTGGSAHVPTVTQSTFRVYGSQTGRLGGTYSAAVNHVALNPANDFKPGELICLTATAGIQTSGGVALRKHVWTFTAAADAASALMIEGTPFSAGTNATSVALGDLDADGDLDALLGNYFFQGAGVWLNGGSGTFAQTATLPAGETMAVGLGDFDADGDLDAVIVNQFQNDTIWLNNGSAGFTQHPTTLDSDGTEAVAIGDVDGDGDLDLIFGNPVGSSYVWVNDGSGGFTLDWAFSGAAHAIGLGDLDGDGDLDAITANQSGSERVWLNDGKGQFTQHPAIGFGSGLSYDLALGDLDGDGDLDVVVANGAGEAETVWKNNGSGTFTAHPTTPSFGGGDTHAIALGDLDGDGDFDAFAANTGGADTVWMNDGTGAFTPHPHAPSLSFFDEYGVALGDVDNDGDLDAVGANFDTNAKRVWLNRDAAGITVAPTGGLTTTEAGGTAAFSVVLNSKPVDDVAIQIDTSDATEGRVSTDGVTQQTSVTITFTPANWSTPQTVTVHGRNDAIDDGDLGYTITTAAATSGDPLYSGLNAADVTATNTDNDTAAVQVTPLTAEVNESGTTDTFTVVLASEPTGNVVIAVSSTDIGEATISPSQLTFDATNWSSLQTVTVTGVDDAIDDGDQVTTITVTMNTTATTDAVYDAIEPPDVSATTLDNEILSIIDTTPHANAIGVARSVTMQATADAPLDGATVTASTFRAFGDQTGHIAGAVSASGATMTFNPAIDFEPGETLRAIASNGIESPADIALTPHVWQFTAAVSPATGALMAHPTTPAFGSGDSRFASLVDLDGDRDLDAVITNQGAAATVWLNDGSGDFTAHPATPSFSGSSTMHVALGDIDADGDADAVVANYMAPDTVWLNDGTGSFTAHPTTPQFAINTPDTSRFVALGDLDGDADLDVMVGNENWPENVLLNDGNGNFAPHPTVSAIPNASRATTAIYLSDLDGDGDVDALLGGKESSLSVWLNDGNAQFTGRPAFAAGAYEAALGDVDDDGDLDAVLALVGADPVWLNDGSADFSLHVSLPVTGGSVTQTAALGDLDGDGDLDLVLGNGPGQNSLWLNDGSGNFTPHPRMPAYHGQGSFDLALGDVDEDGDLDVLSADVGTSAPETVWLNRPPAAVNVVQSGGTTIVSESGTTDSFTVVLASRPVFDVTINVSSADSSEAAVSVSQLTFTGANWSVPQTVTVTGVDDAADDADQTTSIVLSTSTSDVLYTVIDPADVTVTTTDDDKSATSTALASSVNPSTSGQSVTFTATVTSAMPGTITGSVTFFNGATSISTAMLASGAAAISISSLATGTHSITAQYGGNSNLLGSTSDALSQVVNASSFGAPPFFTAAASSTSRVAMSWGAVAGATNYEVHRATVITGPFTLIATVTGTAYANTGLAANTTYLYKVRANGSGGPSSFTSVDAATTIVFTDTTPVLVKALHVTQLRTSVNAMRAAGGIAPFSFTDSILTTVRRLHITELRSALDAARAAIGLPPIAYTDPGIIAGTTRIKRAHVTELRAGTQ